ncbi:MAG: hypothetical protein GW763_17855 [Paraglaciecola sp.]|nr:hypothetical protein [Paraglaciecola sp.]NCT49820.1 hypothetical protein [Paraglaciecola sp.]
MTKPTSDSEQQLRALYQQRKAQHTAPAGIKRRLLLAHQQQQNNQRHWFKRMTMVSVAAGTLLLLGLSFWQHQSWLNQPMHVAEVELHSLAPQKQSQAISERYAKHYQDYLSQQQILVFHHTKQAVLEHMDDGWQLQTCDHQVVKVSQELVNALAKLNQIDEHLHLGDSVDIAFDESGIILAISASGKFLHC